MANKKLPKLLIVGSIAATAFLAGSYLEKQKRCGIVIKSHPALPLFGTESVSDFIKKTDHDISQETSVSKLYQLVKKCSLFESVSAATPISAPVLRESTTNIVSQVTKYGFPGLDNVKSFNDYVLSYDRRNRVAHWVFEHLTSESVQRNDRVDRSKCEFLPDESIHPYFRSQNTDYKRSGYDRGHLAAAGNHKKEQKHIEETFYLSNMAPQVGKGFNRDSWNRLERYVRKLTKVYPNVYCCTGPLYLPRKEADGKLYIKYEVIGANHVAVPTHFYKIVVGETPDGKLEMESYVMPNQVIDDAIPLSSFQVPPESVEKAAGLLFFDNVSKTKLKKVNGKNK